MHYNPNSHIQSVDDVRLFFHHLIDERKLNFHPDEDFANYTCYADNTPTFTKEEIDIYNRLMDESFDVCEKDNVDIYGIGLEYLKPLLTTKENLA
jgi:hypothetical protein